MKPKRSYAPEDGASYDECQTPGYAVDPLLPYIDPGMVAWEPACLRGGKSQIADKLEQHGCQVIRTGWHDGDDFFAFGPDSANVRRADIVITNPPYSMKYYWMRRLYELRLCWALLIPVETIASRTGLEMYEKWGWEELRLKRRVNFGMPNKGFADETGWKSSAQFPVWWICRWVLPFPVIVRDLTIPKDITYARPNALSVP